MKSRKTGVSTSYIVDVGRKNKEWNRKGKAKCTECKYLQFGYYCSKKRRTPAYVNEKRQCKSFIKN